jgi:hypothetical protein
MDKIWNLSTDALKHIDKKDVEFIYGETPKYTDGKDQEFIYGGVVK